MKTLSTFFLIGLLTAAHSQNAWQIKGSDNTPLQIREYGNGQPIILLAGGPGFDAVYIAPLWQHLDSTYSCIVPDQRGTGASTLAVVDSAHLTLSAYVDDLEALRKNLKLEKIILVGHSWGGMLAMAYAAKYPRRTEKLVLLDPGGPTLQFLTYYFDNMQPRIRDEDRAQAAVPLTGYFFDRNRALEAARTLDLMALMQHPEIFSFVLKDYGLSEQVRTRGLKRYKGPVCIIQGRQDPMSEATLFEIKALLPQSQIWMIEKCGHFPWLENEEQANQFFALLKECLR